MSSELPITYRSYYILKPWKSDFNNMHKNKRWIPRKCRNHGAQPSQGIKRRKNKEQLRTKQTPHIKPHTHKEELQKRNHLGMVSRTTTALNLIHQHLNINNTVHVLKLSTFIHACLHRIRGVDVINKLLIWLDLGITIPLSYCTFDITRKDCFARPFIYLFVYLIFIF